MIKLGRLGTFVAIVAIAVSFGVFFIQQANSENIKAEIADIIETSCVQSKDGKKCFDAHDALKSAKEKARFVEGMKARCLEKPDYICHFLGNLLVRNPFSDQNKYKNAKYNEAKAATAIPWIMMGCKAGIDDLGCYQLEEALKPIIYHHPRFINAYMSNKKFFHKDKCVHNRIVAIKEKQSKPDYRYQGPSDEQIHESMKLICRKGDLKSRFSRCSYYQQIVASLGFKQDSKDELIKLGCSSVAPEVAAQHKECKGFIPED